MLKKKYNIILSVLILFLTSCSSDNTNPQEDHHGHEHQDGSTSITQFSDSTEIFMEFPKLSIGETVEFLIHLTDLKDFKAVVSGKIEVTFVNQKGNSVTVINDKPARDGIFIPKVKFDKAGNYTMTINLTGEQVSDKIIVENVKVSDDAFDLGDAQIDENPNEIPFLKEQQWKIEFATDVVGKKMIQESILAIGELEVSPEYFHTITAPVAGTILLKKNKSVIKPGTPVKKGQVLLNISPSVQSELTIQKVKNDYLFTKSEFERVKLLFEMNAVSKKRFDKAKFDFENKKSSYNSLLSQIQITDNGYSIVSPIIGVIENVKFKFGENLNSGQELFSIINTSKMLLKVNIPAANIDVANNCKDASFRIAGYNKELRISELSGKKVSVSSMISTENRTIPVLFEFVNPQNELKSGLSAEVSVKVGDTVEYLVIPETAIIDEDGMQTAYVQINGETFEKRILKTGIIDQGFVQILDGLNEGERVVTKGGYLVRLATLSLESAIGHGHAH